MLYYRVRAAPNQGLSSIQKLCAKVPTIAGKSRPLDRYKIPVDLPVEVLRDILDYLDKADLATMCRVNKICCSYSQDVLYRDILVTVYRREVHWTLAQSTHLARKVRSFDSSFMCENLAMALRNMTSLRILKMSIDFHTDILNNCSFRLDMFVCFYLSGSDKSFRKFLSIQPSVKYVKPPQCFDSRVLSPVEATCLPNLTRIHAKFSWLPYLIPGRPLSEVITIGSNAYEHPIDLSFFALSTTPIQKLEIDHSYLRTTPIHLLASFLPSLTHFTLTVYNRYIEFEGEKVCELPILIIGY
jgi:F-box domain